MRHAWYQLVGALALIVGLCGCHGRRPPRNADVEVFFEDTAYARTLSASLSNPNRSKNDRDHDAHRHPIETLEFFGIRGDSRVIELNPADDYFTTILAPYLRRAGKLTVAWGRTVAGAKNKNASSSTGSAPAPRQRDVALLMFDVGSDRPIGAENSADLIIAINNSDQWLRQGTLVAMYRAAFRTLRPGGVLGVVQHRAKPGEDAKVSAEHGYVPEAELLKAAQDAGFQFSGKTELNANPYDTKDRPANLRSLSAADSGVALTNPTEPWIGETDRMTLRFVRVTP